MTDCPRCGEVAKLRTRDFSPTALTQLLSTGELEKDLVDEPLCDVCYGELRDALIDYANRQTVEQVTQKSTIKKAS